MVNREKKVNFIISALYYFLIGALIFFAAKYLLRPLLPFIFAFIIVSSSQKVVLFISSRSFLSKKAASSLFMIFLVAIIGLILYVLLYSVFKELISLSQNLTQENLRGFFLEFENTFISFSEKFGGIPLISTIITWVSNLFSRTDDILSQLASTTLPHAMSALMSFIKFFPGAVIFITFTVISLFYIGFDYDKITAFFTLQICHRVRADFDEAKNIFLTTLRRIFKAYILLAFITFIQLLCGFLVLRIKYALILAIIICLVDLLPVIGVGTVLIPWSVFCFVSGNLKTAIGLLVLYSVITILRQIAEPKIIGANIGLSPLLSLVSMYLGLKTIGIIGIIIFPILLITVINLNEKGIIRLYKNPKESKSEKINKTKNKFINFKRNDNL